MNQRTRSRYARSMPGEDGIPISDRTLPLRVRKVDVAQEVVIFGHRDPRGPDNNVYIWVDEQDRLHIRVLKAQRCYKFAEMIDRPDYVEIVQA